MLMFPMKKRESLSHVSGMSDEIPLGLRSDRSLACASHLHQELVLCHGHNPPRPLNLASLKPDAISSQAA